MKRMELRSFSSSASFNCVYFTSICCNGFFYFFVLQYVDNLKKNILCLATFCINLASLACLHPGPKATNTYVGCAWKILFAILRCFSFLQFSIKRFVAVEKTVPAGEIGPWSCAKTHSAVLGKQKKKQIMCKMVPFECCILLVFLNLII